jgi:hypothetical protein
LNPLDAINAKRILMPSRRVAGAKVSPKSKPYTWLKP